MERITIKHLRGLVDRLNRDTNSPMEYSTKNEHGRFKANVGHWCISQAYGGFNIERVCNESGGVTCPINYGHIPARELYRLTQAFLSGLNYRNEEK